MKRKLIEFLIYLLYKITKSQRVYLYNDFIFSKEYRLEERRVSFRLNNYYKEVDKIFSLGETELKERLLHDIRLKFGILNLENIKICNISDNGNSITLDFCLYEFRKFEEVDSTHKEKCIIILKRNNLEYLQDLI